MQDVTDDTDIYGPVFEKEKDVVNTSIHLAFKHFLRGELLFLTNFELAAERAIKYGDLFFQLCPAVFIGTVETFHRGVALYDMARKHRKRKFKSRAKKIRQLIKQWVKDGNPNIEHYDLLLDAENASLSKAKFDVAGQLYLKAINSAAQLGHLQHSGLCHERFADFLLHAHSGEKAYSFQMSEAIRCYVEWGAMGKVHRLKMQLQKNLAIGVPSESSHS